MKKVLILANSDVGLYKFRKELIIELINQGYKVCASLPNGKRVNDLRDLGCEFIETNVDRRGTNPIKDFQLFFKYIKIIKEIQPTVILTYTVKPNLYGGIASRLCRVPYICNVTGLGSGFLNGGIVQKIIKFLSTLSFKNAKSVMVQNSADVEQLIVNNITKDNITLIPGSGVNLEEFTPLPYPYKKNPIEFLFIARIMKDKGINEYLEAAKKIKKIYTNVNFNIIGSIEEEKYIYILKEYEKKKIIKYYGFQDDIKPFILKSHCIINPSYTEGMSNVLLESAASSRCIIASNIAGCREIIDHSINGFLVNVGDDISLYNAIETFIKIDYAKKKEMGLKGRELVEKRFDRNLVINEYIKQIQNIVD